ncbi:hypothetical protein Tco_1575235 [Tanacetum coccineum]
MRQPRRSEEEKDLQRLCTKMVSEKRKYGVLYVKYVFRFLNQSGFSRITDIHDRLRDMWLDINISVEDHVGPDVNDDGNEDEPTALKQKWFSHLTVSNKELNKGDNIHGSTGEGMDAMSITDNRDFRDETVLRHAPCSVGVLVDRGLGSIQLSRETQCISAAIIFIAGNDDCEALAYAGRVARHPVVKLIVIRFLLDANGNNVSSRITIARASTTEFEEEMKQDDEYFTELYE